VRQPEPYRRGVAERYPASGQPNYYHWNQSGGGDGSGPSNYAKKKQMPLPKPLAMAALTSSAPPLLAGVPRRQIWGKGSSKRQSQRSSATTAQELGTTNLRVYSPLTVLFVMWMDIHRLCACRPARPRS
jgi:hypothetical protein